MGRRKGFAIQSTDTNIYREGVKESVKGTKREGVILPHPHPQTQLMISKRRLLWSRLGIIRINLSSSPVPRRVVSPTPGSVCQ